jgi:hypothetical protein
MMCRSPSLTADQEPGMARRRIPVVIKPSRNTAPLWKKLTIVLTALAAVIAVMSIVDTDNMNVLVFIVIVVAVIAAVVWLMARILGVRLSLHSWD